ncbi:hypothetical protein ACAN107058_03705 [Paracidovorax anthurii]|uniref:Uncharacterized protein n=2 Tax=Paracidovorax anthurii TaxID=78229 RepID=A0A328YVC4_9BURK|nr:hypothetical protein AX018_103319 [Paracidovorax anthurii]
MSAGMQAFQDGWKNRSTVPLNAALPRQIGISDVPPLPLARSLDMPAQAGFARGSLGIELSAMQLSLPQDGLPVIEHSSDAQGRCVLAVRLQGIALQGTYTVQGTQVWEADLDGAGTALPPGARRRGGTDDTNAHPAWIQTANDQRAALQNVPGGNGATLLTTYSNHRAAFNDVFTDPLAYAFQAGWGTQAISDMAEDTHTALNNGNGNGDGSYVNDKDKQYGGTTYNGNAQTQKLALLTALTALAGSTNSPQNNIDPNNPYNQAAAATLSFGSSVVKNTIHDKNVEKKIDNVPQLTKDGVYTVVQNGTPAEPNTVEEVHQFLNGSPIGGRDAQGNTWTMVLNEDERAFVRKMQADIAEHAARLAALKPVALTAGGLQARLACHVSLQFGAQADGTPVLIDGRVELDGFDLHFDDGGWDNSLGQGLAQAVREALGEARFIKSLLHDRIADALERALVRPLAQALVDAQP